MKYLLLIYVDEAMLATRSPAEIDALWREAGTFLERLKEQGQYLAAAALEPVVCATTLRRRGGGLLLTDGPFAETKEQLAGLVLIDAEHLDAALDIAAKSPAARVGCVEVRPTRDLCTIG